MNSKQAILMSKMGKKKGPTMDSVPSTKPESIQEMRVTDGNTSLDIMKTSKASAFPSAMKTGDLDLQGSAAKTGESSVPKTEKAYSPIQDYLKKRK